MKKDLAVLIMIIVAILAFILGYSLAPSSLVKQEKEKPTADAPGYGDEKAPSGAVAPGYGGETMSPKTTAP